MALRQMPANLPMRSYHYQVGGSLKSNAPSYVRRQADEELYEALERGEFCSILNSRQMGKSSLLVRTKDRLQQQGFQCTSVDLSAIGNENISPLQWYKGVAADLWAGFDLLTKINLKTWWREQEDVSLLQRLRWFIEELLLVQFPEQRLFIFVDEIDSILSLNFPVDDFFSLIRYCYNQRAINSEYNRITFAIFGVATPSDLIRDRTRTPFNIGRAIALAGFTPEEAQLLTAGLQLKTGNPDKVLQEILAWTNGQPFLTQKLCQLVLTVSRDTTSGQLSIPPGNEAFWVESIVRTKILHRWESNDEPEHLKTIRDRIEHSGERMGRLLGIYQQILQTEATKNETIQNPRNPKSNRSIAHGEATSPCLDLKIQNPKLDDSREQIELLLSGLVVKQNGLLAVKNRIYAEVFNLEWVEKQLDTLRPYAEACKAWVASNQKDESRLLRGQALKEAQLWSQGKSLSDTDYQFIAASVECDRASVQLALEAERAKEVEARLAQEQKTAKLQRLLLGVASAGLVVVSLLGGTAWLQYRQAKVSEIQAIAKSSESLFSSNQGLEALVEALRARKHLKQLGVADPTVAVQVEQALRRTVYGVTEYNILNGHTDEVNKVRFSRDGETLASVSDDSTIKLWNRNGRLLKTLKGHQSWISGIDFSPDGSAIVTSSWDNSLELWRRDGTLLKTLVGHRDGIADVAFSPDGEIVASASADKTIKLWKFAPDTEEKLIPLKTLEGHQDWVSSIAFSPDGQLIASTSGDKTLKLWQRDGTLLATLKGHQADVRCVAFSHDGQFLASGSNDGTLKLWQLDPRSRQVNLRQTLDSDRAEVYGVAFSPDDRTIVSASGDNTVRLWQFEKTSQQAFLSQILKGHRDEVWSVAFAPDGKTIASASGDNTVKLWKPTGIILKSFSTGSHEIRSVAVSPDGKLILSHNGNNTLKLWKRDGTLLKTFAGHRDSIQSVAFSRDGKLIASGSWDRTVKLWKPDGSLLKTLTGHRDPVWSVAFSPDSRTIASASEDKTVKLWSIDGRLLKTLAGHQGGVWGVAFSPDGQTIASASWDKTIKLWDRQGRLLKTLVGHQAAVRSVAFSPDGKLLASASGDKTIKLWNREGTLLQTLEGHQGEVWGVAFSADSQMLVSGSRDKTVKLWKPRRPSRTKSTIHNPQSSNGRALATLEAHNAAVYDVAFSPDNRFFLSAGGDGRVILWDLESSLELEKLAIGACNWVRDYLRTHPDVAANDKGLCD